MIRFLALLLPLFLTFLAASPAAVAGGDDTRDHDHHVLRGKIVAIDADAHAFVLYSPHKDHKVLVKVTEHTKIRVDGHEAAFEDLAVGMRARVAGKFHVTDKGHKD